MVITPPIVPPMRVSLVLAEALTLSVTVKTAEFDAVLVSAFVVNIVVNPVAMVVDISAEEHKFLSSSAIIIKII